MQVKIFQPSKSAMQSGRANGQKWVIEPLMPTVRNAEPLMGWIESGDTLSQLKQKLFFNSAAEAESYAIRMGWKFQVESSQHRKIVPRSYLDNFKRPQPEKPISCNKVEDKV